MAYRLALDHPDLVERVAVLDILPTAEYWDMLSPRFGIAIYHWMFLAQPAPFPERLIGGDARYFCDHSLASWTRDGDLVAFEPAALDDYRAMFDDPARIGAMCADYRAGATSDLALDRADRTQGRLIQPPLLDLYGQRGDPTPDHSDVWRRWAVDVTAAPVPSGHFVAEENADATSAALLDFLSRSTAAGRPATRRSAAPTGGTVMRTSSSLRSLAASTGRSPPCHGLHRSRPGRPG